MENISIIVDSREPLDAVNLLREEFKVPVEVQTLEDGDYLIKDWYFTRKTIKDFYNSRNSCHLDDELDRLMEKHDNICFIIEKNTWNTRQELIICYKAMDTLKFLMPVINTSSLRDTCEKLVYYRNKIIKGELNTRKRKVVIQKYPNAVIQMYAALPGIGTEKAKKLYAKYHRPNDLFSDIRVYSKIKMEEGMKKKELKELRWSKNVEGIGDKLTEEITKLIMEGVE